MCFMKSIIMRFNTWIAFERTLEELEQYGKYNIHGEILVPEHLILESWEDLTKAIENLEKYKSEAIINEEDLNTTWCKPTIAGYIVVEITDNTGFNL